MFREGQQGDQDNEGDFVVKMGFEVWLGFRWEGSNSLIKQGRRANWTVFRVTTMLSCSLCQVVLFLCLYLWVCHFWPSSLLVCVQDIGDQTLSSPAHITACFSGLRGDRGRDMKVRLTCFCNLQHREEICWRRQVAVSDAALRPESYLWISSDQVFIPHHYTCLLERKPPSFWASVKMEAGWWEIQYILYWFLPL